MRSKFSSLLILLSVLAIGQTTFGSSPPETLALKASSANTSESARAIAELRKLGPAGLAALFNVHKQEISRQIAEPLLPTSPEWQRLSAALDAVSRQKDSHVSGLYWYTDLSEAQKAARVAGKPILSLRLLGNLNEEFSCANSRFFRTVLYSNAEVSAMLRDKFILHWKSVRPVPHITIDFGDGRKLERTITGNSVHYILDVDGRPIDALPGLYGPRAFLRALNEAEAFFQRLAGSDEPKLLPTHTAYHGLRRNLINAAWLVDIEKTGGKIPEPFKVVRAKDGTPTAIEIGPLAATKMVTEATMLRSMNRDSELLGRIVDEELWRKIAALHIDDARLDARSLGLIQRKTHKALLADGSKKNYEATLRDLTEKLERDIALDTVRNEYMMHTKLHAWFIMDRRRSDLDSFNNKVYAELFLTPASDPWLGLFESSTYVALENGGIVR